MSVITTTSPRFDDCRSWIRKKRNRGSSWEELELACKESVTGFEQFLKNKIEDDDWPEELNADLWKQLISEMRKSEEQKVQAQRASKMAELHDERDENNEVYIPEDENSSWQLYKKYLKETKHFSDDAIEKIEDASIGVLKRLSGNTVESGPVKGLVIGNVQSGKTANIAGLMAMAADWQWNMFIILSGTIESLRRQTQNRIFGDLNHPGNLVWIQFDHLSRKRSPVGQRLTDLTLNQDSRMRYMTVCLKTKSRLEDLIEWIEADRNNIKNLKILVIDDEADQAGVSTGDVYSEDERKTINRLILNLVHCRDKKARSNKTNQYDSHYQAMNYVSYTATPYANCLNETGEETLYPKDFIRTLALSNSYFGAEKIFGVQDADNDKHLDIVRNINKGDVQVIKDIQEGYKADIPDALQQSVLWFICAASVMRYYQYQKPVSMLIHTSQKQSDHQAIAEAVRDWILQSRKNITDMCREIYERETERFTKSELREVYPDYEYPDEKIWDYPSYDKIIEYVEEISSNVSSIMMDEEGELHYNRGIHLCIDNCSNNGITEDGMHVRLAYPDEQSSSKPDFATAFIVVGGNTLSRGLTLEGLVSTFFLRSVKQADTLMQMGRWFGYRIGYELLPRIWLTDDTVRKFELLTDIDMDLREQIYQMQIAGCSPSNFNLTLITSPKVSWMSLTAKKKMQMARPAEVDFSGMDTQMTVYSRKPEDQLNNIHVAENFIKGLGDSYRVSEYCAAYVWENIPFSRIKKEFFDRGFMIPKTSRAFQQLDLLEEWIEKQTEKDQMENWNVMVCGTIIKEPENSEKIWILPNGERIGKINRSCKSRTEDRINIGVLSGKKDYVADITEKMIGKEKWHEMKSVQKVSIDYRNYRKLAGVDKVPLFLIYRIDKSYNPSSNDRFPLNVDNDLIGITMVTPGIRGFRGIITRLSIISESEEAEEEE